MFTSNGADLSTVMAAAQDSGGRANIIFSNGDCFVYRLEGIRSLDAFLQRLAEIKSMSDEERIILTSHQLIDGALYVASSLIRNGIRQGYLFRSASRTIDTGLLTSEQAINMADQCLDSADMGLQSLRGIDAQTSYVAECDPKISQLRQQLADKRALLLQPAS